MSKKHDEINTAFNERWPNSGMDDKHRLSFRGQIAREMLEEESEEYRQSLEAEVRELRRVEDAAANSALEDIPTDEENQERYVTR